MGTKRTKKGSLDNQQRVVKKKLVRKTKKAVEEKKEEEQPHSHGEGTDACCGDGTVIKAPKNVGIAETWDNEDATIGVDGTMMPGKQKVFVKTYGCSHNISDSEYMAGLLAEYGFQLVDKMEVADACLINSCTVKNPSQEKFIK